MFVECPHCYTMVIPTANNICPACRKDFSDQRDTNPNLTSIIIQNKSALPPYCYWCGSATERYVMVHQKVEIGGGSAIEKLVLSYINFRRSLYGMQSEQMEGKKYDFAIKLPQCEQCAQKNGKPEPSYVDLEGKTMTFTVHKSFKDRVHQAQGKKI